MKITTEYLLGLVKQYHDLTIAPETMIIYLFLSSQDGKGITTDEIVSTTGINVKTVRKHLKLLEAHEVVSFGDAKGKEHRRVVTVSSFSSLTIPSTKLPLLYSILNIPSQRTVAHVIKICNSIEEDGTKSRVWSTSDGYLEGYEGVKKAARRAVAIAVARQELIRPSVCSECGKTCAPTAHHHHGYDEDHWLDVVWLCRSCHSKLELSNRKKSNSFTLYDILHDCDWIKAETVLEKYFKGFETAPTALTRKKRFSHLVELLNDESFDFSAYCKWYYDFKYAEKGFNYGLFLYAGVIAEYRDYVDREGKYLKTASRLGNSDSFQSGVKKTRDFLKNLEDDDEG